MPAAARSPGVGRILDLFGDLADGSVVRDLTRRALRAAVRAGAAQVTALAATEALARELRRAGLRLRSIGRFCWTSEDHEIMKGLSESRFHWVLGDSDNDEPTA